MLVGDSAGHDDSRAWLTLPVTVEDRLPHSCRATWRANCLLLSDLPFMAYAAEQAFENGYRDACGANMVKIEGGARLRLIR